MRNYNFLLYFRSMKNNETTKNRHTGEAEDELREPFIGVVRHRLATDGVGVTTLCAFHGCTLRCAYCLNAQCLTPKGVWKRMTPQELLEEVAIDNIYFLATEGGVTFGGGEPLLRSEFIAEFARIKPKEWKINIETALNVDSVHLRHVLPHTDSFIVDVKDTNPIIYERYTNRDSRRLMENLRILSEEYDVDNVKIRLPLIPDYNTTEDVDRSETLLRGMGFGLFDKFEYIIPPKYDG